MGALQTSYDGFIDLHLTGWIDVESYEIGPGAARLGSVTVMVDDRLAAPALAQASIVLEDVIPYLGGHWNGRVITPRHDNDVTAVVTMRGAQRFRDFELVPAHAAADRCGYARFTLGNLRLTVHDRDAAARASRALARAYRIAAATFGPMPDLAQLRRARDRRREARVARRPRGLSTGALTSLLPASNLAHDRGYGPTL